MTNFEKSTSAFSDFYLWTPLWIMRIEHTGTSALTKLLKGTPHGGGPYSNGYTLQGIK